MFGVNWWLCFDCWFGCFMFVLVLWVCFCLVGWLCCLLCVYYRLDGGCACLFVLLWLLLVVGFCDLGCCGCLVLVCCCRFVVGLMFGFLAFNCLLFALLGL